MELWQIEAPHFVAGFDSYTDPPEVWETAPIIKYMKGWSMDKVKAYCDKKGWKLGRVR